MSGSPSAAEKLLASFLENPPIAIIGIVAALVMGALFLVATGGGAQAEAAQLKAPQAKKAGKAAKAKASKRRAAEVKAQRAAAAAAAQQQEAEVEEDSSDDEDEPSTVAPVQKAKKKRRKRSKKKKPKVPVAPVEVVDEGTGDEWSTVKIKVKTKSKKKSHKVQKSGAPAADQEKKEIEVMSKRIGTIIGQKGATINAIKDATNCQIDIQDRDSASETTVITITGDAEDVKYAAKIINETVKNNYCKLMKGESFKESSIMVPAAFHHTIIGSGGSTIKMLKNIGGGVEIGMPNKATGGERVKLGGDPADIDQAKQAINELMQFTHSSILEPGKVHIEIAVPTEKLGRIIGPKGQTVKHIQGSTGTVVRTPDRRLGDLGNKNVVIIGTKTQVAAAKRLIEAKLAEAVAAEVAAEEAREAAEQQSWDSKTSSKTGDAPVWQDAAADAEEDGW